MCLPDFLETFKLDCVCRITLCLPWVSIVTVSCSPWLVVQSVVSAVQDWWDIISHRSDCYYSLPPKHVVGLMNVLVGSKLLDKTEICRINRVCHFKGVFVLTDVMTHCDGVTPKESMLTTDQLNYREGVHRYPIEYPIKSDFALWKTELFTIFPNTNTLSLIVLKIISALRLFDINGCSPWLMNSSFAVQPTRLHA